MRYQFTVPEGTRATLRAALALGEKKAKAAVTTNKHLELNNGEKEAGEFENLCAETIMAVDAMMADNRIELNAPHMYAARTALRVFVGTVRKKEHDLTQTLALEGESRIDEVQQHIEQAETLLRALNVQSDAFTESAQVIDDTDDAAAPAPDDAGPYTDTGPDAPDDAADTAPRNDAKLALVKGARKKKAVGAKKPARGRKGSST